MTLQAGVGVGGTNESSALDTTPLGVDSAGERLSFTCSSKTLLCSSQRISTLHFSFKCEYSVEISIGNVAVGWYQFL